MMRDAPTLVAAVGDIATRPGMGILNFAHFGRVLKHRQLEMDYEPIAADDFVTAIAIERRVSQSLYPERERA